LRPLPLGGEKLQISREVGVTEPTIFYHFKNKQHFFNTILEDALSRYLGRLEQSAAEG
jgi:AcrR family transcriptional regulator